MCSGDTSAVPDAVGDEASIRQHDVSQEWELAVGRDGGSGRRGACLGREGEDPGTKRRGGSCGNGACQI